MPTVTSDRAALDAAYRATRYCVDLPDGRRVALSIDQPSPVFAAALQTSGIRRWAIVAAANPGSQLLPDRENADRQRRLVDAVSAAGRAFWVGVNEAEADDWPVEPTLCVLDLELPDARRLGAAFGQNAIVVGGADGLPMLVWVESAT